MSGGHLCDYKQYEIGYIADEIEQLIIKNGKPKREEDKYSWDDSDSTYYEYPPEVIEKFKEAILTLRIAQIYAHRVDWLVSGDDSEGSFLRRLQEDLQEVKRKYTNKYFDRLQTISIEDFMEGNLPAEEEIEEIKTTTPSSSDDLVPFHQVCGCTFCNCIMANKMVPNPAKYGGYSITTRSSTTIDPKLFPPIEPF